MKIVLIANSEYSDPCSLTRVFAARIHKVFVDDNLDQKEASKARLDTFPHAYTDALISTAFIWCSMRTLKTVFGGCEQQRRRPACAYAQTGQHLCYSLI